MTTKDQNGKPEWHLSRMPNYHRATELERVDARAISGREFRHEYVYHNRPCVLSGAASAWPAAERWSSIDYLKSTVPDVKVRARNAPLSEYADMADGNLRQVLQNRNTSIFSTMGFHHFLDRATSSGEQLVLHALPLGVTDALAPLRGDIGQYSFLPTLSKARLYAPLRAFFYRNSYTDWHFHLSDETLTTQLVGTKEVLILPPGDAPWDALYPVARQTGYLYNIDEDLFPAVSNLVPFRTTLRAGDVLYIPAYWWHAVASADDRFGVTIAATFRTPFHVIGDTSHRFVRHTIRDKLFTKHAPLVAGAVTYSFLYRKLILPFL